MTDADFLPPGPAARAAFWRDELQRSRHIKPRVGRDATSSCPRVVSACSSRSLIVAGDNWITVGDAAAAFDPLSSQGVAWALASGLAAAETIDGELRGRRHALHDYARQVEAEFSIYLEAPDHYGRERWPDSPFWLPEHDR